MAKKSNLQTITRDQYEAAKKLIAKQASKVDHAKSIIEYWEGIEELHQKDIGSNTLSSICVNNDDDTVKLAFEAVVQNGQLEVVTLAGE
jgi:hypothetical protein